MAMGPAAARVEAKQDVQQARGGRGGNRSAPANPLLNPNAPLSGQGLQQAATSLTNAQTQGPITELAKQIAANDAQTAAAQKAAAGYYGQLGQFASQGLTAQGQIAGDLNSQLSGIAGQEQSTLQGLGQSAMGQMAQYSPGGSGLGASGAGAQALATEIARQQGLAAQGQGAFRASGATQGANYRGLSASNMGAYALGGQEGLTKIGQAGQLKNVPLNSKIAGLQASRGALLASNEGKLRQQEISNKIANTGLGIKSTTASANIAYQQGQLGLGAQRNAITSQNNLSNQALHAAQFNQKSGYDAASLVLKQQALNLKGGPGAKPLTTAQQKTTYTQLDEMITLIQQAHAAGHTGPTLRTLLATGRMQRGFPAQSQVMVDAAFELLGYGSVDQKTAAAMNRMGLRGGTYNGAPIKVTKNFNPGNTLGSSGGLGSNFGP
jgi:hypothetical protein